MPLFPAGRLLSVVEVVAYSILFAVVVFDRGETVVVVRRGKQFGHKP
jgi:hypothetical protein